MSKEGKGHCGRMAAALLAMGSLTLSPPSTLAGEHDRHEMHQGHVVIDHGGMDHSKHQMPAGVSARTVATYAIPDVTMTGTNGEKVALRPELERGGAVMVNFIYTSCTTVCPVLSGTFSQVQDQLGPDRSKVSMLSISIDPEYDTPARLGTYARKFGAGPQWQFLTGSIADAVAVQRAFDTYRGNKMNHTPVTLMRAKPDAPWVRIEGFASAEDIIREYRRISTE